MILDSNEVTAFAPAMTCGGCSSWIKKKDECRDNKLLYRNTLMYTCRYWTNQDKEILKLDSL